MKAVERVLGKVDLPLEAVILLVAGLAMLITGALLFPISSGRLPYYEDGLYGLLLVMVALQIIGLGKTPFGDVRRSRLLIGAGVVVAAIGMAAAFIPGILGPLPRILVFAVFGPGGLSLLLQMLLAKDKFRTWARHGGILRQLIAATSSVYVLQVLIAALIWNPRLLTTYVTAVVVLGFGAAILYLAAVLRTVYRTYPQEDRSSTSGPELSTEQGLMLVLSVFMVLLGVLLIPVSLGLLPFSASAQLGLLMVIFALQMLAVGSTPLGPFPRTWLMISLGLVVAALGIVSAIVPNLLVALLAVLVGVLNILGGAIAVAANTVSHLRTPRPGREPPPPVPARLAAARLTTSLVTILFGLSMLVSGLIPGVVIGVILAANGCVLLYMLRILLDLDRIGTGEVDDA